MKKLKLFLLLTLLCPLILTGCKEKTSEKQTKEPAQPREETSATVNYNELSVKELSVYALEKDAKAAYRLGQIYDYGLMGESQNYTESLKWYEAAADKNYGKACSALGYFYLNGCGVDRDFDTAKDYFTRAIKYGDEEGYVGYGRIILEQKEEENYHLAFLDFKEAAAVVLLDGVYYMGYMYQNGYGVTENINKAVFSYNLVLLNQTDAIEDRFAVNSSTTGLGIIYATGKLEKADGKKAIEYFESAAEDGFAPAQYYLGTMYLNGIATNRDYEEALNCFESAGEKDYAPALCQIGYMYFNGLGVDSDYEQAVYYQKLAAAQGYAPAQINLGFLYENGYGVEKNLQTALSYYRLANEQGYEGATEAIVRMMDTNR